MTQKRSSLIRTASGSSPEAVSFSGPATEGRAGSTSLESGVLTALETSSQPFVDTRCQEQKELDALTAACLEWTREHPQEYVMLEDSMLPTYHPVDPCPVARVLKKITTCGRSGFLCANEGEDRCHVTIMRCKSRLCPWCSRRRSRAMAARVSKFASRMDQRRFITLTLQSSDRPLAEQLKDLHQSFARLRRSPLWKKCVTGGIYTVEVTFSKLRDQWHPHVHCIADGTFMPVKELSEAWKKASRGSFVVDIRQVYSNKALANYIAKYIVKTGTFTDMPGPRLKEWIESIHGLRMLGTFGKCHGMDISDPDAEPREKLHRIISINFVSYAAASGDDLATILHEKISDLLLGKSTDQACVIIQLARSFETRWNQRLNRWTDEDFKPEEKIQTPGLWSGDPPSGESP